MFTLPLTDAQQAVLAFMVRHEADRGGPPTLREIAEEFGYASATAALKHVQALGKKGYATHSGDGRTWAAVKTKEVQEFLFTVPVYGTIPAGLAADNPQLADETIRIDPATFGLRSTKGLFALQVRGDSMIGAQIADGDIALLRAEPARPGQIVAALIDGATTLKRLVQRGKTTVLRAENRRYRDLIPSESLTIQGVCVGIIGRGQR